MPPGDQQQQVREVQEVGQTRRQGMALKMVDRHEG